MTTRIADIAQATPVNAGLDARALRVAQALRHAIDAECVILFGSRARTDWTERSDIDLMIIEPEIPEAEQREKIEGIAKELANRVYQDRAFVPVDFVYLTRAEYEHKSVHTLNHVSRFARREGVMVPRDSNNFPGSDASDELDYSDERMERQLRIADANMYYEAMHIMLDAGMANKATAYNAHQVLEHAMKALISAQGHEYRHTHALELLLGDIRANDPHLDLRPRSNLPQLDNFAGGTRYGPLLTPISDYTDMANRVTDDLNRLYDEVARLTGENPWDVPPEGSDNPIEPRHR